MKQNEDKDRQRSGSNKVRINFVIDLVIFAFMLLMIGTGLVIRYILPAGTGGGHGGTRLLLFGMNRHDFGDLHAWFAFGLVGAAALHVALHWTWVCRTFQRIVRGGAKTKTLTPRTARGYGLVFLLLTISVLGAFIWFSDPIAVNTASDLVETRDIGASSVYHQSRHQMTGWGRGDRGESDRHTRQSAADISGRMTLRDVSVQTGVSVESLKHALHLPTGTSSNEPLGRLKRRYGFEIADVRHVVATTAE
jgi:hypothetical protein